MTSPPAFAALRHSLTPRKREAWRGLAFLATALLVLCVTWAPAALGSNRPLAWAVNALLAGTALMLAAAHAHLSQRATAERLAPVALPLLLVVAVIAWIAVQALVPVPPALAYAAWGEADGLAGLELTGRISANPGESLLGLLRLGTAAAFCVAALMLAREPARARLLVDAFVAAASLYALYGLYRLALAPNKVLWFDARGGAYLAGPFLSRSQAATYFGLAAIAALAMLIHDFRRLARPFAANPLRVQVAAVLSLLPWALGGRLAAFLLVMSALVLTGSRAGIAAAAAAIVAVAALAIAQQARRGRHAPLIQLLFAGLLVVLLVSTFEVAGGRLVERLLDEGLAPGGRLVVYARTLTAIADHAWLGSGYGTFQDVFPLYRPDAGPSSLTWDKAHNDYLELMLGLGLPAAVLFLSALATVALIALRGALSRRRDAVFPTIAAGATLQVGLHALVDFSLQIQAITLAYALLLGVGLAQARSSREAAAPERFQTHRESRRSAIG